MRKFVPSVELLETRDCPSGTPVSLLALNPAPNGPGVGNIGWAASDAQSEPAPYNQPAWYQYPGATLGPVVQVGVALNITTGTTLNVGLATGITPGMYVTDNSGCIVPGTTVTAVGPNFGAGSVITLSQAPVVSSFTVDTLTICATETPSAGTPIPGQNGAYGSSGTTAVYGFANSKGQPATSGTAGIWTYNSGDSDNCATFQAIVTTSQSYSIHIDGTSKDLLVDGSGNILLDDGSGTLICDGSNCVVLAAANSTVALLGSNNLLTAGSGSTVVCVGSNNTILLGANSSCSVQGDNNLVVMSSGTCSISGEGNVLVICVGSVSVTLSGADNTVVSISNSGQITVS